MLKCQKKQIMLSINLHKYDAIISKSMCILLYCETYSVQWCSIDLWSVGGYICPRYMCILLYVKCIWCSGVSRDLWLIGGGGNILSVCNSSEKMSSLWNLLLLHRCLFYKRPIRICGMTTAENALLKSITFLCRMPMAFMELSFLLQCIAAF